MEQPQTSGATGPQSQMIDVSTIIKDDAFQMRSKLDKRHVKTLRDAFKNGAAVEAIKVAEIEGRLYVIDGFHRLEAFGPFGEIAAIIEKMDKWAALERAAAANLTNALPLKSRERKRAVRTALKAYLRQRKHIAVRGERRFAKSFREIARDLNDQVSHETIRQWIRRHHKATFERWWGGRDDTPEDDFSRSEVAPVSAEEALLEEYAMQTAKVFETYQRMADPRTRGEALAIAENWLNKAKISGGYVSPEF